MTSSTVAPSASESRITDTGTRVPLAHNWPLATSRRATRYFLQSVMRLLLTYWGRFAESGGWRSFVGRVFRPGQGDVFHRVPHPPARRPDGPCFAASPVFGRGAQG